MFHTNHKKVEEHTKRNEQEVLASDTCGCLGCMATLKPGEVTEGSEDTGVEHPEHQIDRTAICPHCGDALIIGDRSGYRISDTFLEAMRIR